MTTGFIDNSKHGTSENLLPYSQVTKKRRRPTLSILGAKHVLAMTFLSACISISHAYAPPPMRVSSALFGVGTSVTSSPAARGLAKGIFRRITNRMDGMDGQTKDRFIKDKFREEEGDNEEDDESAGWLSWMVRGRVSRGTADLLMREAEELGGLPRSDRYSSRDWLHNTITLPSSAILRDIRGPVTFMTTWAFLLSLLHKYLDHTRPTVAAMFCIPTHPHSLMVSALSLLLVFKTNSAYQRFAEGRLIWEKIINCSRDFYRLLMLYENEIGKTKRRRLQRLLAAFPYLLRHRIRPNLVMYRLDDAENVRDPEYSIVLYQDRAANELDPETAAVATQEENEGMSRRRTRALYWVDKRSLPWRLLPPNALEPCARAQNRPLWVCDRMAQELRLVPDGPQFSARERLALISKVDKLSACIGACERIHQTAVPLNYARHSLRALTLWLFTLPFALVESLRLLTAPVLFLVSWLLFGVYEIGYSIEDPFQGTLRLSVLCDSVRRDVLGDEIIRSTAFEIMDDSPTKTEVENTAPIEKIVEGEDEDYESAALEIEDIVPQFFNVTANGSTVATADVTTTAAVGMAP